MSERLQKKTRASTNTLTPDTSAWVQMKVDICKKWWNVKNKRQFHMRMHLKCKNSIENGMGASCNDYTQPNGGGWAIVCITRVHDRLFLRVRAFSEQFFRTLPSEIIRIKFSDVFIFHCDLTNTQLIPPFWFNRMVPPRSATPFTLQHYANWKWKWTHTHFRIHTPNEWC